MLILQVVAREIVSPMEIDNRTRLNAVYRIIVNVVAIGYPWQPDEPVRNFFSR